MSDMEIDSQIASVNKKPDIDLREISIMLDGWVRTCDTVLKTLSDQINKINNQAK